MVNDTGTVSRGDVLLIQFARSPVPGQVKTRMIPALSESAACDLHRDLVLWTCRNLCGSGVGEVELWVAGETSHAVFRQCLDYGVRAIYQQRGADLGQRMCHALADGLRRYDKVILVGSDCPAIDGHYLSAARAALASHCVVLGPAEDGGYVLIGATEVFPELFTGIAWGQASVYSATVEALEKMTVSWQALDCLPDIDRPADLPIWMALKNPQ